MDADDTFDPSLQATRKIESMSSLVAEMIVGAEGEPHDAPRAELAPRTPVAHELAPPPRRRPAWLVALFLVACAALGLAAALTTR